MKKSKPFENIPIYKTSPALENAIVEALDDENEGRTKTFNSSKEIHDFLKKIRGNEDNN